ncbi:and other transporter-domain-containing protein [Clohesyomyces aquaticus]|uniref:And other transporter-domain-containing protein n=1 Tax=Clohesyomyces aquaticus TaxID=1231657 RepID=A0A1Y1ZTY4_9PLEO|nr:and other transporter-domain-containing protein [Clohesyomyces aquaticus]
MGLPTFPKIYNVYFLAIVATIGGMLFGFDISSMILGAIIGTPQYIEYFDNPSGVIRVAIGSALAAGSVLGSIIAGPVSDKIGRRDSLMFAYIVQAATNGRGMLIAGRFLNGLTVAKHSQRASFRTAWGMQIVPCVSLMIGLPFLPRSPHWLAKVDRTEEAIHVQANIQAGECVLTAERLAAKAWRKFVYNGMRRRTFAGISVQAWKQLSGANVMTYYIVYIFYMADLSGNVNRISSGIGRGTLLLWGAIAMAFCHFVVGGTLGAYYTYVTEGVGGNANVAMKVTGTPAHTVIAFSYLPIIIYAMTLAPICWVYAAEVWSLETRAWGMGIAAIGNRLFSFVIGLFIPPAFLSSKWKLLFVFGLTYLETCGKTIEEIEVMFSDDQRVQPNVDLRSVGRVGDDGPRVWHTKKGNSRLDREIEEVVNAKAKREARASISRVIEQEKNYMSQSKGAYQETV